MFKEGDKSTDIYLVVSGDFKLSKSVTLKGRKQTIELAIVSKGEIIGDREVIEDESTNRGVTWISMSQDSCLLRIARENFFRRISNLESW